jgi:hypothetical protein
MLHLRNEPLDSVLASDKLGMEQDRGKSNEIQFKNME